jgi:A/G-specific adenine glycosylase
MKEILAWWRVNGRAFPWRETTDPFKVLIAEMLLQRSRSGSVAKVYSDLFEKWPGVPELAQADVLEIEAIIHPLGLKTRATRIKAVAEEWSARKILPRNSDELQELPGVGPYTANATAAAMSWTSKPCMDSVSVRVMRRYLGDWDQVLPDTAIESGVYTMVSEDQWRELNWAILDLAAAVCMPKIPRCQICPLKDQCEWSKQKWQKPT